MNMGRVLLEVLPAIMTSFMLFFIIDISYNLRRLNNQINKINEKK